MNFRADHYYQASLERLSQARKLYRQGDSFGLSMYCGGLAVECLLRAFRWTEDASFEGRHDLWNLFNASHLLRFSVDLHRRKGVTEQEIDAASLRLRTAMLEVVTLWHNNLRFASEARTLAHLRQIKRVQGLKGDPLKKNA